MATLYDTLGVDTHATDEEIKRAYRKAAMKWHPDRNSGAEDVARATFQEIKDAYAILSDAAQRKVYDAVYAEQMRGWQAQRARQQAAQAEREAAARAADEAAYAKMVSLAMRFADDGHHRDVIFGVLLGRDCETQRAAQIADSVAALQASRREAQKAKAAADVAASTVDPHKHAGASAEAASRPDQSADSATATATETATETATASQHNHRADTTADANPAGALGGLWFQFLNGLRF